MTAVGFGSGCTAASERVGRIVPSDPQHGDGTVYNVSRSFQVATTQAMAIIAAGYGVASGLWVAVAFAW